MGLWVVGMWGGHPLKVASSRMDEQEAKRLVDRRSPPPLTPLALQPLICAFDSDRGNYKSILQSGQMGEGKVQNL